MSTADGRVGLPWPGAPPCRLSSVLPAPGTLPAHTALLWESENGTPSGSGAPPPLLPREGKSGACRAAKVGRSATILAPCHLFFTYPLPPTRLRVCRAWGRVCVSRGPAAHIWPAAGTRPLQSAADSAPSVGAERRRTSFWAWTSPCRRRQLGDSLHFRAFRVPPVRALCPWVQAALSVASLTNPTLLGPLHSAGHGLADPLSLVAGCLKPCSTI